VDVTDASSSPNRGSTRSRVTGARAFDRPGNEGNAPDTSASGKNAPEPAFPRLEGG
jgi:hypothetical protein